jgi:putative transposase
MVLAGIERPEGLRPDHSEQPGPSEAHRRYTRMVNFRVGWRGHLWQGRFASFVFNEAHLLTAARYVELQPVRAGLISAPSRYL